MTMIGQYEIRELLGEAVLGRSTLRSILFWNVKSPSSRSVPSYSTTKTLWIGSA